MGWRRAAIAGLALMLGGCFVVNTDHREEVIGGGGQDSGTADSGGNVVPDGGDAGFDAGPGTDNRLVDTCGSAANPEILVDSEGPFIVDTTDLFNRFDSCGSSSAPGNDGFIAIDVQAGDLWHFHVIPDPATPGQVRDPFLYLVFAPPDSSCDTRACTFFSNACTGGGDEHFAFVAPEDGVWYLGIDDAMPGGGVYQIEAIRLFCGDSTKVHGEACDGSGTCNGDCQEILSDTRSTEVEANDNQIESNFLEFPATNALTINGNIGGNSCTYPDVYNFRVPTAGSTLSVQILKSDGTPCDNASLTPFDIVLRDQAGEIRAPATTNPTTGCSELNVTGLDATVYFLSLEHALPIEDRLVTYSVNIEITPP